MELYPIPQYTYFKNTGLKFCHSSSNLKLFCTKVQQYFTSVSITNKFPIHDVE